MKGAEEPTIRRLLGGRSRYATDVLKAVASIGPFVPSPFGPPAAPSPSPAAAPAPPAGPAASPAASPAAPRPAGGPGGGGGFGPQALPTPDFTTVERLDKQLRRYKRRLKDHHRNREFPIEAIDAPSYILASNEEHGEDNEPATLQPVIVAEMETRVPYLSVGEAVMQMELAGAGMLVFRNVAHGGVNVVHRRDDGNIGWIDPRLIQ